MFAGFQITPCLINEEKVDQYKEKKNPYTNVTQVLLLVTQCKGKDIEHYCFL